MLPNKLHGGMYPRLARFLPGGQLFPNRLRLGLADHRHLLLSGLVVHFGTLQLFQKRPGRSLAIFDKFRLLLRLSCQTLNSLRHYILAELVAQVALLLHSLVQTTQLLKLQTEPCLVLLCVHFELLVLKEFLLDGLPILLQ